MVRLTVSIVDHEPIVFFGVKGMTMKKTFIVLFTVLLISSFALANIATAKGKIG